MLHSAFRLFIYFWLPHFFKAEIVSNTRKPGTRTWAVAGVLLRQRRYLRDLCQGRCRQCIHSGGMCFADPPRSCATCRELPTVPLWLHTHQRTRPRPFPTTPVPDNDSGTQMEEHRGALKMLRFLSDASCSRTGWWTIFHSYFCLLFILCHSGNLMWNIVQWVLFKARTICQHLSTKHWDYELNTLKLCFLVPDSIHAEQSCQLPDLLSVVCVHNV